MKKIEEYLNLRWEERLKGLEIGEGENIPILTYQEDPFKSLYYLSSKTCPKCGQVLYKLKLDEGYNFENLYTCPACEIFIGEGEEVYLSERIEDYSSLLEKGQDLIYPGLNEELVMAKIRFLIFILDKLALEKSRERDLIRNRIVYKDKYLLKVYTGLFYYPYSLKRNFKKERFTYKAMSKVLTLYMLDKLVELDFKSENIDEEKGLVSAYKKIYEKEDPKSQYNYFKGSPEEAINLELLSKENILNYSKLLHISEDETEYLIKEVFEYVFAILLYRY